MRALRRNLREQRLRRAQRCGLEAVLIHKTPAGLSPRLIPSSPQSLSFFSNMPDFVSTLQLGAVEIMLAAPLSLLFFQGHPPIPVPVVRSMAMHRDHHKVVDRSVVEQSAADNLATIVNSNREQGIQVPVGARRKECA
jgi:hypothetical protein